MYIFEVQYFDPNWEEDEDSSKWLNRTLLARTWEGALSLAHKYEQDGWEICNLRREQLIDDIAEEVPICQQ
jgi:hypothetical protein